MTKFETSILHGAIIEMRLPPVETAPYRETLADRVMPWAVGAMAFAGLVWLVLQ